MAYGREDPDPVQLEKAKLILRVIAFKTLHLNCYLIAESSSV